MKNVIKVLIVIVLILIIVLVGVAFYLETNGNKTSKVPSTTYNRVDYNSTNSMNENKVNNTVENVIDNTTNETNETNTTLTNVTVDNEISNEIASNEVENTVTISIDNEEDSDVTEFNSKFDTTKETLTSEELKQLVLEINSLDRELLDQHSSHFVTISFLDVNGDRQSIAVDDNKMVYTSTDIKLSENKEYKVEYKDTDYDKYIDEIYIDE